MNILFTIRYFYPFIGGTEKQALTLASCLVKKGANVRIITSRFERQWPKYEIIDGVEVIRLLSPKIKVIGALAFLFCLAFYLIKNREKFFLIHTFQIGYTSSLSILLGILLRKPSLIKLASSGWGGDVQRARKTLFGKIFLFMSRKATRIISVSTTIAQELLGVKIVNTSMLGALLKATQVVKIDSLIEPLNHRFGRLAERNFNAMKKAFEETVVKENG